MFTGTILLLGGTGKVARQIAPLLHPTYPVVVASRSGSSPKSAKYTGVKFDWNDKSTWDAALSTGPTPVTSVWLVAPGMLHPGPAAKAIIDLAREKGAVRFVLLSSSQVGEGDMAMGEIHQILRDKGEAGELEWAALLPSWFQGTSDDLHAWKGTDRQKDNFATQEPHLKSIKGENTIYSATGPGKIPWVSTRDIAAVAHHALTSAQAPNKEFLVLGGELYTYNDVRLNR